MKETFRFKKFSVRQDRCAMKVGTDGVLLGAWAGLGHRPNRILDIGAGTGLVSLMLAQRSTAQLIDGLELDPMAYEQCVENFEASPWSDRLFCYHASLEEFLEEAEGRYDLIVCNPPYFAEVTTRPGTPRARARQNSSLPYEQLMAGVGSLLLDGGTFSTIVPSREEPRLRQLAAGLSLFAQRLTHVRGHAGAPVKRSLLEFAASRHEVQPDELVIETERHLYTAAYRSLTADFYLKM